MQGKKPQKNAFAVGIHKTYRQIKAKASNRSCGVSSDSGKFAQEMNIARQRIIDVLKSKSGSLAIINTNLREFVQIPCA